MSENFNFSGPNRRGFRLRAYTAAITAATSTCNPQSSCIFSALCPQEKILTRAPRKTGSNTIYGELLRSSSTRLYLLSVYPRLCSYDCNTPPPMTSARASHPHGIDQPTNTTAITLWKSSGLLHDSAKPEQQSTSSHGLPTTQQYSRYLRQSALLPSTLTFLKSPWKKIEMLKRQTQN